jgi:hemerythrin superfamily protein
MPGTQEDIIDDLLAQHQQIKLLFAQVATAPGEHKQQLFQELVRLLAVHESLEQAVVHPLAERELVDAEAVVPPRIAEERDAKQALNRLYELGVDSAQFDIELAALRDAVTAHAEAEEEMEFGQLRQIVEPERLQRMVAAMEAAALLSHSRSDGGRPHAPAELFAGPPAAVFDRVRDAVRDAAQALAGRVR